MRAYLLQILMLATFVLMGTGCFTLGPREKQTAIAIQTTTEADRVIETGIVDEKVKLEIWFEDKDGTTIVDTWDLHGMQVVRPDIAKAQKLIAPTIRYSRRVKIFIGVDKHGNRMIEDQNIGGWYVRTPKASRPTKEELSDE